MMNWDYGNGHMSTGGWLMMGVSTVLVMALVVALVVLAVRALDSGRDRSRGEDPLDVLKRRYAAGELNDEEFEQRRKKLGSL